MLKVIRLIYGTIKHLFCEEKNDTLCEYDYVKTFADNFGCELTEQKGGEHWFHTDFELDFSETGLEKDFIKSQICGGNTMLENTPTQSTMTELLGQPLFKVWQDLCSAIDEKYDMENGCGTQAVRIGLTNINIVEAVRRFAVSMQKIIALVL